MYISRWHVPTLTLMILSRSVKVFRGSVLYDTMISRYFFEEDVWQAPGIDAGAVPWSDATGPLHVDIHYLDGPCWM